MVVHGGHWLCVEVSREEPPAAGGKAKRKEREEQIVTGRRSCWKLRQEVEQGQAESQGQDPRSQTERGQLHQNIRKPIDKGH